MTATELDETDPFEQFNRFVGMGQVLDCYPLLAEMRCEAPIVLTDVRKLMGLDETMPHPGGPPLYTACTFDAVLHVLRDNETFSSKFYEGVMGAVMGHTILEMDEPEHHRYRALLQQAFTKRSVERWEHELVRPIIDDLIDQFAPLGQAELVRQLTFPFPVNVIAGMLGLPREDLPQFHRWTVELISVGFDWQLAVSASAKLRDYLAGVLAERRAVLPANDLVSVLAYTELDGHTLTDEEIFAFLRLLLPAGAETTYRSSSNLFHALLSHPDQLVALRDDRSLLPAAIEEGLRWEPPLLTIMRQATRDTEVCGVPIEKGAIVVTNLGSANHDESRWPALQEFYILREARQHAAFAFGPHMCLGQHLARMETRVVVERVLDRLPGIRFDPSAEPVPITGMTFRTPTALPVLFDAS